jgi:hypothetical protein
LASLRGNNHLTILHDVFKVNFGHCVRADLANEFRFLMARLYDTFVRVDDLLFLLGCDDRLLEL